MMDSEENFFNRFIKRNLPIISIIGVFLAVSKYFYADGTNLESVQISIICTMFVIFLLLMFLIDSFWSILKQTREDFNKPLIKFLIAYPTYIPSIITIFFVIMLTVAITFTMIKGHVAEVNLIIIFTEMFVGFFIAAIGLLYILIRVNDKKILVGLLFISFAIVIPLGLFGDLQHQDSLHVFNEPFARSLLFFWALPLIEGAWFVIPLKLFYIVRKEKITMQSILPL
ncbi:MAG: hypothetical protein Q7J03_05350 [Methanoregula sp.]|nr:hypothetical protein [Methanoregula sp.]